MSVEVRVPSMLQKFTGGEKIVHIEADDIGELLANLEAAHPGIGEQLMEPGADGAQLRRFVNVFLNDEDVRFLDGMGTATSDGDVIAILPALAGGGRVHAGGAR